MKSLISSLLAVCFVLSVTAVTASAEKSERRGHWQKRGHRIDRTVPPIPEPTGALLFGAGLLAAGAAARRRQPQR